MLGCMDYQMKVQSNVPVSIYKALYLLSVAYSHWMGSTAIRKMHKITEKLNELKGIDENNLIYKFNTMIHRFDLRLLDIKFKTPAT
jgi:tellurite resistance protein